MYRLYGRQGAGSVAPQLLLEELGLPYEMIWVTREEGQQADYRSVNPTGKVPALVLPDGTPIFESAAIVIHLTLVQPSDLAPPPGTTEHARFLQWMAYLSTALYETFLRFYYSDRYSSAGAVDAPRIKSQAHDDLDRCFDLLETALSPNLLGERLSAADFYLWMLATWAEPSPEELYRHFPKIGELARRIEERPAAQKVLAANRG